MTTMTAAILAETLRNIQGDIYVQIPAAKHFFYAKVYKKTLLDELSKLPQDKNIGLQLVEDKEGNYCLAPTRKLLKELRQDGFSTAPSMKGEDFADTLRTTKGMVWLKFPTAVYEKNLRVKVSKSNLADNVETIAANEATNMRIYGRNKGEMFIRAH